MGIQVVFSRHPAGYHTVILDKLRAGFELAKFFYKGLFFPENVEVWFSAPSEASGGTIAERFPAENLYVATQRLYDYLGQLSFEDSIRSIIMLKGIWEFNGERLAGYFSIQNDANWREAYGDIEISAYAKGEFEDLVDALWATQPIPSLIRRLLGLLKTATKKSSLSLSQVTFSRGIPTKEDPTNLMAIYFAGERRSLLGTFYMALRQSRDRSVIFKAKPLNTLFFINTLVKDEIAEERITKRLDRAIVTEIRGRSALYIAKDRNSFATLYKEISDAILKPALEKLPKEETVRERIHEGLEEYREQKESR